MLTPLLPTLVYIAEGRNLMFFNVLLQSMLYFITLLQIISVIQYRITSVMSIADFDDLFDVNRVSYFNLLALFNLCVTFQ
jgi:hypothetical protein